ncbi:MAG TPA: hypothetical protein VLJ59_06410 [Mycobacteriales bacterium]|nr:hypothetical protein [Mycobacteriales bacterium]
MNVVQAVVGIIVAIIVIAIGLILLGANQGNMLVNWFTDAGRWLTTPFHGVFTRSDAKQDALLNWGLAAIVYAVLGGVIARFTARF